MSGTNNGNSRVNPLFTPSPIPPAHQNLHNYPTIPIPYFPPPNSSQVAPLPPSSLPVELPYNHQYPTSHDSRSSLSLSPATSQRLSGEHCVGTSHEHYPGGPQCTCSNPPTLLIADIPLSSIKLNLGNDYDFLAEKKQNMSNTQKLGNWVVFGYTGGYQERKQRKAEEKQERIDNKAYKEQQRRRARDIERERQRDKKERKLREKERKNRKSSSEDDSDDEREREGPVPLSTSGLVTRRRSDEE